MIKLKKLHKSYMTGSNKLHVLKGIDLRIETGELVLIMGSSGSGKSTLLNIIGLLDTYDSGEYQLDDRTIKKMNESRRRISEIGFSVSSFKRSI